MNTISQGNAVFIGEEGLDISAARGRIPGLDGGLRLRISLPLPRQIRLILPAESPVLWSTPSGFNGYPGNWYRLNGAGKADGIAIAGSDTRSSQQGLQTEGAPLQETVT